MSSYRSVRYKAVLIFLLVLFSLPCQSFMRHCGRCTQQAELHSLSPTTMSIILEDLGVSPIPGEHAAGVDAQDDPEFDRLHVEIKKLGSPGAATTTDWSVIYESATLLLAERSKDLRVASYLCAALVKQSGLSGLASGLKIIDEMMSHYWETLFPLPARMRGRRAALQWLIERCVNYVTRLDDNNVPQDPDVVQIVLVRLNSIEALLANRDPNAPTTQVLADRIAALPTVPAASDDIIPPDASSSAPDRSVTLPHGADHVDVDRTFETVADQLHLLSGQLRATSLANANSYRWNRFATWGAMTALPAAERRQTRIAGPHTQLRAALLRMESSDIAEQTVLFCEAQLAAFPFWLDLNRVCAHALTQLGEAFRSALDEVENSTSNLIARLPELIQLRFSDGTSFADQATIEWISAIDSGRTLPTAGPTLSADLSIAIDTARTLANEGKLQPAINALERSVATATPEEALRARIALCDLMLNHHPGPTMLACMSLLVAELDRHDLDRWAPALALDALSVAHAGFEHVQAHDKAAQVLERIARIDLSTALKLTDAM